MDLRTSLAFDWPAAPAPEPGPRDPRRYTAHDKSRDGTFIRVRAIRADDPERLIESFPQLAAETGIDPAVHVGLVATVWIEGSERIVGLAGYSVDPWTEPRRAEAAFEVLDEWQGRGIGTILLAHLARVARGAGVDVLYGTVQDPNPRMMRLFEGSGLPLTVEREGSGVQARLVL